MNYTSFSSIMLICIHSCPGNGRKTETLTFEKTTEKSRWNPLELKWSECIWLTLNCYDRTESSNVAIKELLLESESTSQTPQSEVAFLKFESQDVSTGGKNIQVFCTICLRMSFPVMSICKALQKHKEGEQVLTWVLEDYI